MLAAFGNDDLHRARKTGQLAGARIRHDDDVEVRLAARHRRIMLQRERAAAATERAGHFLHGDIAGRSRRAGHGAQHLALRDRIEIAVIAFVDRKPRTYGALAFVCERERLGLELDLERTGGALAHGEFPLVKNRHSIGWGTRSRYAWRMRPL